MVSADLSDKGSARRAALAARRALGAPAREAADHDLVRAAVAYARGRSCIAAYVPMSGEPGGRQLLAALAAAVATVLLPILRSDWDLDWAAYTGELEPPGSAGFRAPVGERLGVQAVRDAELLFVPALAVDRDGNRLGRGGGCYDRALARVSPGTPVVALLYPQELHDRVPTGEHDQPVSAVLLPTGVWSCVSRRTRGSGRNGVR